MLERLKQVRASWYYMLLVLIFYFLLFFIDKQLFIQTSKFFYNIIIKVIPVLIVIFILMAIINYSISPKKIIKYLGKKSGIKGWLLAIGGGIISHGPIYMWYPLMADLRDKGMRTGLVAAFLYNRAIKIPLLPFMILYFSWQFVLILTIVMIIISVFQGIIVELIMNKYSKNENENSNSS